MATQKWDLFGRLRFELQLEPTDRQIDRQSNTQTNYSQTHRLTEPLDGSDGEKTEKARAPPPILLVCGSYKIDVWVHLF